MNNAKQDLFLKYTIDKYIVRCWNSLKTYINE